MVKQQVESREDPIVPQAPPETTADTTVAALDPTLSDEDGAVLDAMRVPQQLQPRELTAQEIEAKYATTGIWAIAPKTPKAPSMVTLDDLFMTSIDPVSTSNDAVALPTLASFGGIRSISARPLRRRRAHRSHWMIVVWLFQVRMAR